MPAISDHSCNIGPYWKILRYNKLEPKLYMNNHCMVRTNLYMCLWVRHPQNKFNIELCGELFLNYFYLKPLNHLLDKLAAILLGMVI